MRIILLLSLESTYITTRSCFIRFASNG